ncbi:MAG: hypothetical protein HIU86_01880 [Acidobacteria bacterium]|nr:hypothetical protein [Acidobacteriota bacterium]
MGIRERGRRAVRRWTAAVTLLGLGATGVASVGTFVAIEHAAATGATSTTSGTSGSTSSGTGTSSSSTGSSGLSAGSGSSVTTSSGS